jgi:hypothetical protein
MDDLTFQLFHYMFFSITKKTFNFGHIMYSWYNCQKNGLFKTKITNKCSNVQPTFTTYFNTFNN